MHNAVEIVKVLACVNFDSDLLGPTAVRLKASKGVGVPHLTWCGTVRGHNVLNLQKPHKRFLFVLPSKRSLRAGLETDLPYF